MVTARLKRILIERAPLLASAAHEMRGVVRSSLKKSLSRGVPKHVCPICRYEGPFLDYAKGHHRILMTECPRCGLYERHRLQYLVMMALSQKFQFARSSILHFAPERQFSKLFRGLFGTYHTADIEAPGVDFRADIRRLPFRESSYDVVYASHVLEHVIDDLGALDEIRRVLRPGGFAVLPVPVVAPTTVEYCRQNPHEFGHVRAVGPDYFGRYERVFFEVDVWNSDDFDEKYQLYTYEDRSGYPSNWSPLRLPMAGHRHRDYVPVCFRCGDAPNIDGLRRRASGQVVRPFLEVAPRSMPSAHE